MLGVGHPLGRTAGVDRGGMRGPALVAYVALAAGILFARRPDAVLHPQFWAEDGYVYYADAYNHGAHTVLTPAAGYLVLIPRLTALLAQPLGLARAPTLFNLVGLAIQLLPALFILSNRFGRAIPSPWVRGLIGIVYLLIPDYEVHATVTNAQWHLAILMCMVIAAAPARGALWRAFDIGVLVAGGLSGPLVILVAPLALARWLGSRERWYAVLTAVATVAALLQLRAIHESARSDLPLGAGVRSLIRLLADRMIVPMVTGEQNAALFSSHWSHGLLWASLLVLATLALAALAMWRGPAELRVLLGFAAASLAVALHNPLISPTGRQWPPMLATTAGIRYFLAPSLAVAVLAIWGISHLPRPAAVLTGGALAVVFLAGTASQLQYPPLVDHDPAAAAAALDAAPRGTVVNVPINPTGWSMSLRKH